MEKSFKYKRCQAVIVAVASWDFYQIVVLLLALRYYLNASDQYQCLYLFILSLLESFVNKPQY